MPESHRSENLREGNRRNAAGDREATLLYSADFDVFYIFPLIKMVYTDSIRCKLIQGNGDTGLGLLSFFLGLQKSMKRRQIECVLFSGFEVFFHISTE